MRKQETNRNKLKIEISQPGSSLHCYIIYKVAVLVCNITKQRKQKKIRALCVYYFIFARRGYIITDYINVVNRESADVDDLINTITHQYHFSFHFTDSMFIFSNSIYY